MSASTAEKMKERLKARDESNNFKIKEIDGDGYSQVEVSQNAESPDPRVGGTKIIFDSRFDDYSK
jgi:hypothetical protein